MRITLGWQEIPEDIRVVSDDPLEKSSSSSSSSSSQKCLEWPKQQRHHEDHYSQSKYSSRIKECCNSSGISMSSNGAGRLTGTERRCSAKVKSTFSKCRNVMCATYFVIRYVTENDLKCTPLNIFLLVVSSVLWLDSCANTGTHIREQVAQLTGNRTSDRPAKRLLFSTVS